MATAIAMTTMTAMTTTVTIVIMATTEVIRAIAVIYDDYCICRWVNRSLSPDLDYYNGSRAFDLGSEKSARVFFISR
jgi:hypothetical protein